MKNNKAIILRHKHYCKYLLNFLHGFKSGCYDGYYVNLNEQDYYFIDQFSSKLNSLIESSFVESNITDSEAIMRDIDLYINSRINDTPLENKIGTIEYDVYKRQINLSKMCEGDAELKCKLLHSQLEETFSNLNIYTCENSTEYYGKDKNNIIFHYGFDSINFCNKKMYDFMMDNLKLSEECVKVFLKEYIKDNFNIEGELHYSGLLSEFINNLNNIVEINSIEYALRTL